MKFKFLFFILFFILCQFVLAQSSQEGFVKSGYEKKEFMISMRDGVKLYTAVYIPLDTKEQHPILMTRTPYSCKPYGEKQLNKNLWNSYLFQYMQEGYIYVEQDVRGKWMSEGDFENVRPYIANKKRKKNIDEASDTYDTVDWLVKNITNNNGRVGIFGISYPGFYSTMGAAANHPAIKAASPQAPVYDWFIGDDFHQNGAFRVMDAFRFFDGFGNNRPVPTAKGPSKKKIHTIDNYSFFLKTKTINELSKYHGDSIAFWNDMLNHPNYDEWWTARCAVNACADLKPAMLVVGGTFDAEDGYGAWATYRAIKQHSPSADCRLIIGPWSHGAWGGRDGVSLGDIQFGSETAKFYQQEVELPFFNYHLKGEGDIDKISDAVVFFSGENNWKRFSEWPSKDVFSTNLYLSNDGLLSFEQPFVTGSYTEYISDPAHPVPFAPEIVNSRSKEYMVADQRFANQRPDVLTFCTDVLSKDLTLGGPIIVDLDVAISTTDADFVVKVIDVFPDDFVYDESKYGKIDNRVIYGGYQMMVRGDVMRGKFRNSFSNPEAFLPFTPTEVSFEMPDVAHTFQKGHRLMVQIQSSWFPLIDMNPQTFVDIYKCSASDFQKSTIRILHQKDHPSKIIIPVLQ